MAHHQFTGEWPWEDKDSRLLMIPVPDKLRKSDIGRKLWGTDLKKKAYVSYDFFDPTVARGFRAVGARGAYDTAMAKGRPGQVEEAAEPGLVNAAIHPFMGPVARGAFALATGNEPIIIAARDDTGKFSYQTLSILPKTKPGADTLKARALAGAESANAMVQLKREIDALDVGTMTKTSLSGEKAREALAGMVLRGAVNTAAPGLVARPYSPAATAKKVRDQNKALTPWKIRRSQENEERRIRMEAPLAAPRSGSSGFGNIPGLGDIGRIR